MIFFLIALKGAITNRNFGYKSKVIRLRHGNRKFKVLFIHSADIY